MNIAFDSTALLGSLSKGRGIAKYTQNQLRELIHQNDGNRYFLFNIFPENNVFEKEIANNLLREDDFLCVYNGEFLSSLYETDIFSALVQQYVKKNAIDIFYITSPFERSIPTYQKAWFKNTSVVITVYDIIPFIMQERYLPREEDKAWYLERVEMLRWADRLLAISQSVKDDLIRYLDFDGENIDVIWGAADSMFQKKEISRAERQKVMRKFRIDCPYILCTGGDDERKNIAGLIRAFGRLPQNLREMYQLVVVCKLQPTSAKRYMELAKSLDISDRIILTNYVTDEELVQLYNLSEIVAFPSLYEGFGLPVVEAWACGKPVLTSSTSSLGQITGNAAIQVDPASVEDIARGLEAALTTCNLPELAQLGMQRLKDFQWSNVARETVRVFKKLGSRMQKVLPRHKIAYFTPLPPAQSGISDYSVDIINALSKYFDIDVFIDDGYAVECQLPENVTFYRHTKYAEKRLLYKDTVYQMGNSEYHVYMWPYLQNHGGTLVLHDYNMRDIAQDVALNMHEKNLGFYRKLVMEDLSQAEAETYLSNFGRGISTPIELNGFVTNYADKIIVHSWKAKEKLLQRDISRNIQWIPHYAKIEPLKETRLAKAALGIEKNTLIFSAFGHIHPFKRIIPILYAFAEVVKHFQSARLVFVGKLIPSFEKDFWDTVRKLRLTEKVFVTGFIGLDKFEQYIDGSDVCLNLRWPYNGETSGSLMRILAKGKCVIVNDIGSFSEIPDNVCVKIPSAENMSEDEEVSAICSAMIKLAANENSRKLLQRTARKFAEEHLDITKIALQYTEFILSRSRRVITESLLEAIKREINIKSIPDVDVQRIAYTLAYVKGAFGK